MTDAKKGGNFHHRILVQLVKSESITRREKDDRCQIVSIFIEFANLLVLVCRFFFFSVTNKIKNNKRKNCSSVRMSLQLITVFL